MNLNQKAQRYLEIKSLIKSLELEMGIISEEFKEKGSFSTADYQVEVLDEERNSVVSMTELIVALGEEVVINKNLSKKTKFQKLSVKNKVRKSA